MPARRLIDLVDLVDLIDLVDLFVDVDGVHLDVEIVEIVICVRQGAPCLLEYAGAFHQGDRCT
jgi:hypothetical protein